MSVFFLLVVFSTSLCLIESRNSRGNTIATLYFRGIVHRSLYTLRLSCLSKRDVNAFSTPSRNGLFVTALLIPKKIKKHTKAAVLSLFSTYLQEASVVFPNAAAKPKNNQRTLQNNNVDNNKNNILSSFGSHSIKPVLKRRKRQTNPCSKALPFHLIPDFCFDRIQTTEPTDKSTIKITTTSPDILTTIPETTVTTRRTTSTTSNTTLTITTIYTSSITALTTIPMTKATPSLILLPLSTSTPASIISSTTPFATTVSKTTPNTIARKASLTTNTSASTPNTLTTTTSTQSPMTSTTTSTIFTIAITNLTNSPISTLSTSKNTTNKSKTTVSLKKHFVMMNTTTSNTKSSSVSSNLPTQQATASIITSESFTPATKEDVIQHIKLQNQDSSSSFFDEPLNIVIVSTVAALVTITSTVGILYYMYSKVTGARRKRSNSILNRSSSTGNSASYMDGEGSSSRASPFTANVLSNAGSDWTLTPIEIV